MSDGCTTLEYRRLRAPRENGSRLIEPPLSEVSALLSANEERRRQASTEICCRPLADLAQQARGELLAAARAHTARYRDLPPPAETDRLLLAGHQPQLFHPGVWYKNFVLSHLAQRERAVAINLQVDSDTIKRTGLRVPGGSSTEPTIEEVHFDAPGPEIPFEERTILDRGQFGSFAKRVQSRIAPFVANPLVGEFWKLAVARANETENLGAAIAEARHQLEGQWGLNTLELPLSKVCALPSFRWFTLHNLVELPRLREYYNASVHEYRRVNHVRSANHPVPDLIEEQDWLEAPYWIWKADQPRRRRLFVRRRRDVLELRSRDELLAEVPIAADCEDYRGVEALAGLADRGIKLRTRALMTTLFARLLLGDLFLHGIGGAKYDEVTDLLFRRFYGVEPPGYLVVSATLELPIAHQNVREEDVLRIRGQLRELVFHPEKYLRADAEGSPATAEMVAAKQAWIEREPTRETARTRCRAIRAINEELQASVASRREELEQELSAISAQLRSRAILGGREFSFCLYPAQMLQDFLLAIPRASP